MSVSREVAVEKELTRRNGEEADGESAERSVSRRKRLTRRDGEETGEGVVFFAEANKTQAAKNTVSGRVQQITRRNLFLRRCGSSFVLRRASVHNNMIVMELTSLVSSIAEPMSVCLK
jgi:hypothetical protein